jgi:ABC-2 type transport system ATP-binding protein
MKKIIEVNNLTKSYNKKKAIDNLSFCVYENEILGLLGPNGSGKTTLINSILGLLNFEKGQILIMDKEMKPNLYEIKKEIGVVFQDIAVFEELNVYDNINYFCALYIKGKEKRAKYVSDALKLTGLTEFIKYTPNKLSGGLKRRLNIACGIAHKPSIIFLDEPTVAVDPQSRNNILEGIKKLNKMGATIIYTSHYMEEVEQICTRIIILDNGKKIATGTTEDLKNMVNIDEKIRIEIKDLSKENLKEISNLKNIKEITYKENILKIIYENDNNNLATLINLLNKKDITYSHLTSELPTLNDVFLELTGKELRDET